MKIRQRVKSAIVPARYQHWVYPMRHRMSAEEGPPPSLDANLLDHVVESHFGRAPLAVAHAPMAGYKHDSVYRIWVRLGPGRYRTLVFKNARLSTDAYPAIRGFPGRPGVAEWGVLGDASDALTAYLPAVLHKAQLEPNRHYQYLLEDLAWANRPVLDDPDVVAAVRRLPGVHTALAQWADATGAEPAVDHGPDHADEFLAYVETALHRFVDATGDSATRSFLTRWDEVATYYRSAKSLDPVPLRWIHGDFNRKNAFLGVADPTSLRLVDWEWTGIGPPHADLASILKRSAWGQQRAMVREFFAHDDALDHAEHWQIYLWCRLGRGLFDAALHANQNASDLGHTSADVAEHLDRVAEVMATAKHLPVWGEPPQAPLLRDSTAPGRRRVPRVTIAMPVHNGARFLVETIESILAQTYTDFDLIISDNASTDETATIATTYVRRDPRVRYVRHTENVGAHHNYNGMLDGVESEYFKWAADDDLYSPVYLERCVAYLDAHPEAVLAYPHVVDIDEEGDMIEDRPFDFDLTSPSPVARFRTYLGANNACLPIFGVHRTEALNATGRLGHYAAADRVLLAELTLHGSWVEIPEPLFQHREHEGRSVHQFPNPRDRGSWFAPGRTGPDPVYWKRFQGYRRAIRRAPVTDSERAKLYTLLAKWGIFRTPDLALDVVAMARGKSESRPIGGAARD